MNEQKGWKPMPRVLKIIWVFTILSLITSVMTISTVYSTGIEVFGLKLEKMAAVNMEFFFGIFFPLALLIGMWLRNRLTWLLGVALHVIAAANVFFMFYHFDQNVDVMADLHQQLFGAQSTGADLPAGFYEAMLITTVLISAGINVMFIIFFVMQRNYFKPLPQSTGENPENKE